MTTTTPSNDQTIDQLNSFLRGELAAVETYRQALSKIENATHRATLEQSSRSHQNRVDWLNQEIQRRGGSPAKGSGIWGTFAKAVEGTAKSFSDKAAIAALEEGEDHGKDDYQKDVHKLDATARQLIESRIIPEQRRTHDALSALKRQLS